MGLYEELEFSISVPFLRFRRKPE